MLSKYQLFIRFFLLIISAEGIFLLPFVLVRIFRPTVLQYYGIDNLELGSCFAIYGLVAIPSYFIGGLLADRFQAKYLLSFSLMATAIIGLLIHHYPSVSHLKLAYFGWGMSTILLFWAPLHKFIRLWMKSTDQGKGFGGLEAGRGAIAASIGMLAAIYFTQQLSYPQIFKLVCYGLVGLSLLILFVFSNEANEQSLKLLSTNDLKSLEWRKVAYLGSIILIAYSAYKITDDVSLYAYDVLGMNEKESALIGSISLFFRPLSALLAGFLADRFSGKVIGSMAFALMALAALVISSGIFSIHVGLTLIILAMALIGIYGIRGIYFSLMRDVGLNHKGTGTAIGVMSVIGYLPDIFMSPIMGYFLDENPGELGHQIVFGILAILGISGFLLLYKLKLRESQSHQ